jgi:hypothetical protein
MLKFVRDSSTSKDFNLIFLYWRSQFWLDVVSKIVKDHPGENTIVVDVSGCTYPMQSPWRVPSTFERGSNGVREMFSALGADYIDGDKYRGKLRDMSGIEV